MEKENLNKQKGRPKALFTRKNKLTTYWTDQELVELVNKAKAVKAPLSFLIRQAVLTKEITALPEVNSKQYSELARLAGNLNQFVKLSNQGKIQTANLKEIIQIQNLLNVVRLALLGVRQ
jgi:hypothetical protein